MQPDPTDRPRWHRPRTQLFRTLSWLWFFPSLGALVILALNWPAWRDAGSLRAALAGTRFEQWVALGLLLAHPILHLLARRHARMEKPVALPPDDDEDAPDHQPKKIR